MFCLFAFLKGLVEMIVENEKIKILGNRFKKHRNAIVISVVRMDKNKGLKNVC